MSRAYWRNIKKRLSDYDAAIALARKGDGAAAYFNRAIAKKHLGKYDAAIADYDSAIGLDPEDANAYFGRGLVKKTFQKDFRGDPGFSNWFWNSQHKQAI